MALAFVVAPVLAGCSRISTAPTPFADLPATDCDELFDEVLRLANSGASDSLLQPRLEELSDDCPREFDELIELVSAGAPGDEPGSQTPSGLPDGTVMWNEAAAYVGTTQRVCGPVATVRTDVDDVFFNIGFDHPNPDRFTIVVWDVGEFGGGVPPGAMACALGEVMAYQESAQIHLYDLNEIEFWG